MELIMCDDKRDGIATFILAVNSTILNFIPAGQNPLPPRYYRSDRCFWLSK
jgi:hypothetical protein